MTDIILVTINARYTHTAFGLRYLMANLEELRERASILEFQVGQKPVDMVETILAKRPRLVGVGVYIWNIGLSTQLVQLLKAVDPNLLIVLGGPEVSYDAQDSPIVELADHVISGEADLAFATLCRQLLEGDRLPRFIEATPPDLNTVCLPYELYGEDDLAKRVIYLESSRGCPMSCDFCLSALDSKVRLVPLDAFLASLGELFARGARSFKFVDRSFNLLGEQALAVLDFFLALPTNDWFVHLECTPDGWSEALRSRLAIFPAGTLQLEIGLQTFDSVVSRRINRPLNQQAVEENLEWLRRETQAHLHLDLVVGLPGEDLEGLASGFDELIDLQPHEIQVGLLKRLRGAPIKRHDTEFGMRYDPEAPYEILCNRSIDFGTMQRIKRFARYWDIVANSGNFLRTLPLLWEAGSPFAGFMAWSDWLFARAKRTHAIALEKLAEYLWCYLTEELTCDAELVAECLKADWHRANRGDGPECVQKFTRANNRNRCSTHPARGQRRQARHRGRA